jgi:hypothetical protein
MNARDVLAFVRTHPESTREQIVAGGSGPRARTHLLVTRLQREGWIERSGGGRRGSPYRYRLAARALVPSSCGLPLGLPCLFCRSPHWCIGPHRAFGYDLALVPGVRSLAFVCAGCAAAEPDRLGLDLDGYIADPTRDDCWILMPAGVSQRPRR